MKGYLASGFFNKAMYDFTDKIADILLECGVDCYVPQRNDSINDKANVDPTNSEIWDADISYLKRSDILVAVIDDEDAGVMAEIAYFASMLENTSKKGLILGLYTDSRRLSKSAPYYINIMVLGGIEKHGQIIEFDTWEEVKVKIPKAIKEFKLDNIKPY